MTSRWSIQYEFIEITQCLNDKHLEYNTKRKEINEILADTEVPINRFLDRPFWAVLHQTQPALPLSSGTGQKDRSLWGRD